MGYHSGDNSDLIRLFKESRNFSAPNFISYMESHDEERVQFKNAAYGNNGSGNYSVKDLQTAMQRTEAAVAFLMGSPGPKMIWQFGEFGYDVSIDHNGRTGEKPLRWNYLEEASRKSLFDQYARLIRFKKANMIFRDADLLEYSLKNGMKYFVLSAGNQKVMILANFDVVDRQFTVGNLTAGTWYDNITDGIVQWNEGECLMIEPGAYCVLSKTKLNN
jgi:glycosidase